MKTAKAINPRMRSCDAFPNLSPARASLSSHIGVIVLYFTIEISQKDSYFNRWIQLWVEGHVIVDPFHHDSSAKYQS